MENFLDQIDVRKHHSTTAVAPKSKGRESLALVHLLLKKLEVLIPFVAYHLSATEAPNLERLEALGSHAPLGLTGIIMASTVLRSYYKNVFYSLSFMCSCTEEFQLFWSSSGLYIQKVARSYHASVEKMC